MSTSAVALVVSRRPAEVLLSCQKKQRCMSNVNNRETLSHTHKEYRQHVGPGTTESRIRSNFTLLGTRLSHMHRHLGHSDGYGIALTCSGKASMTTLVSKKHTSSSKHVHSFTHFLLTHFGTTARQVTKTTATAAAALQAHTLMKCTESHCTPVSLRHSIANVHKVC